MHIRMIAPAAWITQPWKNDGGVTHELVSEKDKWGILWRLSIAEVNQDGPFSLFPDIDRVIVLLKGDGFRLTDEEDLNQVLDCAYHPFHFAGERAIQCTLLSGAVRDFNLMTRRNQVKEVFQIFDFNAQPVFEMPLISRVSAKYIVFVAVGAVEVRVHANTYFLQEHHTLIMDADAGLDELRLVSEVQGSVVFFIQLIR